MSSETKTIKAIVIFEILGKPAEHLKEALEGILKRLGEEKDVEVKNKTIHEPKTLNDNKDLFTTFAEVEVEFTSTTALMAVMFAYMPAHIEIHSPEHIIFQNNDLNEFLNELARRLHAYDEVARVLQAEKTILERKLKDLMGKKDSSS